MHVRPVRVLAMSLALVLLATGKSAAQVASLSEGFANTDALIAGGGWFNVNNSTTIGSNPTWTKPDGVDPPPFPAHVGGETDFASANFQATTGSGTISLWLITPQLNFTASATTLTFYTRTQTTPQGATPLPDRMEVRLSTAGDSIDVGTSDTSVGVFSDLRLSINPTLAGGGYPEEWSQYTVDIPAQAGNGRLAFRYFVTDGGPLGENSNFIGVDTFVFAPVPEPGCLLLVGAVGLAGFARRRLRRA